MDKKKLFGEDLDLLYLYENMQKVHAKLASGFIDDLNRLPSFNDMLVDRWERAKKLGFGSNTNVYDSSLIIGNVIVGEECWIGPNTVLDGSGRLVIGDYCTVSAGVQIYTHDNVKQTLSNKRLPIEREEVVIGNNVYIAPNVVIAKGVSIGNNVVVGAFSFVNKSIPSNSVVMGQPAKVIGFVEQNDNKIKFNYGK